MIISINDYENFHLVKTLEQLLPSPELTNSCVAWKQKLIRKFKYGQEQDAPGTYQGH